MAIESIQDSALLDWKEFEDLKGELMGRLVEIQNEIDPRVELIRLVVLTYETTRRLAPEKLPALEKKLVDFFFQVRVVEKVVQVVTPCVVIEEAPQCPPIIVEEEIPPAVEELPVIQVPRREDIEEKIKQLRSEAAIYRKAAQTERDLAAAEAKKRALDPLGETVKEAVEQIQGIRPEDHGKKAADYETIAGELSKAADALQNS